MNFATAIVFSSALLSVVGCNRRDVTSSGKSATANVENDSIVLVAASDSLIQVAVFEEKGRLIEKGDHFCSAPSNGMGGVREAIRTDDKLRCFRTKEALLAYSENGQRLECNRAENTHDGLITRCTVWESFNRGGLIDARVDNIRGETFTVKFKAKPYTEPMFCNVLIYSGTPVATYGCYPSLDALKTFGKLQPSSSLKRFELQCNPDPGYVVNKMYSTADCQSKPIP